MRGTRTWLLLLGYAVLVIGVLTIMAWSELNPAYGALTPGRMGELGRNFFVTMVVVQTLLGALVAPALTSGAISVEREQGSWDLLLITQVRVGGIVFGKFVSALLLIVLLSLVAAPLMSVCFLLGGVAPDEFAAAYAVILSSAVCFGAVGMLCSARCARTTTAVKYAFAMVLFALLASPLWTMLMWSSMLRSNSPGGWGSPVAWAQRILALLNTINPIHALMDATDMTPSGAWLWSVGCYLVVGLLLLPLATKFARRFASEAPRATQPPGKSKHGLRLNLANPVLQLELLPLLRPSPSHGRLQVWGKRLIVIGGVVVVMAYLLNTIGHSRDWRGAWMVFSFMQLIMVGLISPLTTASAFTLEREKGSLALLMLTILPSSQIIAGKLLGRLTSVVVLILAFAPLMVLCAALGEMPAIVIVGTYSLLATAAITMASMGLFVSARFRRTVTALGVAEMIAVGLGAVLPILMVMTLSHGPSGNIYFEFAMSIVSPLLSLAMLSEPWSGPELNHAVNWVLCCGFWLFVALCVLVYLRDNLRRWCANE